MSFMRKFGKSRESSFWRQLAAAESIDVDGATIRSSIGSRQGLEICRQLVWIVEERIEFSSFIMVALALFVGSVLTEGVPLSSTLNFCTTAGREVAISASGLLISGPDGWAGRESCQEPMHPGCKNLGSLQPSNSSRLDQKSQNAKLRSYRST